MFGSGSTRFPPGTRAALVNLHRHCEPSAYLLGRVDRFLAASHCPVVDDPAEADVLLVNTCVVTDAMRDGHVDEIVALAGRHPGVPLVVLGCLAATKDGIRALEALDPQPIFVAPSELEALESLFFSEVSIRSLVGARLHGFDAYQPGITADDRFLLIGEGCSNRCSYCAIKGAKGRLRSRPVAELVAAAGALVEEEDGEVVLLADDCGSYGTDLGTDLPGLLDALFEAHPRLRLKIYTMYPGRFLDLYEGLAPHLASGRVTYLCLPLQSGSPRILGLMSRPYDLDLVRRRLGELRAAAPALHLFSHFIVGFPTESDEDFEASLEISGLFDDNLFIAYGENARTPAARIGPKCTRAELAARQTRLQERLAEKTVRGTAVFN